MPSAPPAAPPPPNAVRPHAEPPSRAPATVLVWMATAIVIVATLAFWDERREARAALGDFADEQASIAAAVSAALSARLATLPPGDLAQLDDAAPPRPLVSQALAPLVPLQTPGSVVLLVSLGDPARLYSPDGTPVAAPELAAALGTEARWARLDRAAAAAIGLPERTAMAGIARLEVAGRPWRVAVVATAQRERDREQRAQVRVVLGVAVASGLVLAFGGLALRKQRKQLELARELAVAEVARARDEQLVRADKLATMGALATGIAHEISTPLGVIVGRADQLAPKLANDERGSRAVRDILDHAERITRVVRGFLTLARGESPALEHVDPAQVAENAMALVEHRFVKSGVALEGDIAKPLPRIACEPRLFEQALANLLLNASDACDPGGHVELRVRADRERVAFVVTDDGSGIAPDVADRVTEPFFTTKPTGKGTGLGLAIANEIVKHHNGSLTVGPRALAHGDEGARASTPFPSARGTRACIEIPSVPEALHG